MGIKNVVLDQTGLSGVYPRFIYIETDDTLAEVTATGYLNTLKENFQFQFDERMMALVSVKSSPGSSSSEVALLDITKSGNDWSLIPSLSQVSLDEGQILVGNSSNVGTGVDMSGDATISNSGEVTLEDDSVSLENLDDGITPSHITVFADEHTTAGGAAAEAITVTGVLATDLVFAQLHTEGTTPRTILTAVASADTVTITFSGDPSNDHVVTYQVLRAAS